MASSFAHMIEGWTRRLNCSWAKPQSVLAMTFSRPTSLGEPHDAFGDEFGMLDDVCAVADDAGGQDLAFRQLDVLPDAPFVFVAGIGGFDEVGAGADLENEIDDLSSAERRSCAARASFPSKRGNARDLPGFPPVHGSALRRGGLPIGSSHRSSRGAPSGRRSRRRGHRPLAAGSRRRRWRGIRFSTPRPGRSRALRRCGSIRSCGRGWRWRAPPPEGTLLPPSRLAAPLSDCRCHAGVQPRPVYFTGRRRPLPAASRWTRCDRFRLRARRKTP